MPKRFRPTQELSDAYVKCRAVGHAWDDFTPIDMRRPQFGWRLSLRCTHGCGTERHDLIDSLGRLISREYRYEDAYKEAGIGTKGVPRNDFRRELALRRYGRAARRREETA